MKSIQAAVTKFSRGVSSGTASQEINFRLSLERALEGIEAQLRTEEVNMVMECLRNLNTKRFHTKISFIADMGLNSSVGLGESIRHSCIQCAPLLTATTSAVSPNALNKVRNAELCVPYVLPVRRMRWAFSITRLAVIYEDTKLLFNNATRYWQNLHVGRLRIAYIFLETD